MPAKPGLMLRLMTMTVRALSTSRMGMPKMGLEESVRAAGLVTSLRANHQRDVGLRKLPVDVVHLDQAVVGNIGFGQQHVHVARHAAGHGMDGEAHVHAALAQRVKKFPYLVLRLGHRHAVAWNDDDRVGGGENGGGSSAVALRTVLASCPATAAGWTWPKAPKRTLPKERFMAFDMMTDRMKPEEPSSAPARIRSCCQPRSPSPLRTARRKS